VSDASDYVPAYDQRTYAQAIKALADKLNETTDKVAPRARFQFKPRTRDTASTNDGATDPRLMVGGLSDEPATMEGSHEATVDAVDSLGPLPSFRKNYNEEMSRPGLGHGIRKPSFSAARDIDISGQTGLHIILPSSASRATSSGRLTDLVGCIVDMSVPTGKSGAPFAGLHLKDIRKSLIIAGHVAGAVHITGVSDSILVVAARQVRIHECKNVDVYLHCTSHPIIEDCSAMRFAPIPSCYVSLLHGKATWYSANFVPATERGGPREEPVGSGGRLQVAQGRPQPKLECFVPGG
jgi:tubulin-specific chaperone C